MTEQMMQMSEEMALEELTTEKELRRRELEQAFGRYNFVVVRKELFAHLRDPAVTIRKGSITFNTACINGLEDVVFVQLLLCEDEKKFAVKGCQENDKDALRWCIAKPDKRKSRKMTCPDFTDKLYELMHWDSKCRYKILGYPMIIRSSPLMMKLQNKSAPMKILRLMLKMPRQRNFFLKRSKCLANQIQI